MNEKEELKYTTIEKIINNEITIKEAMYILNQSRRNVNRLVNKYKIEVKDGFIYKNKEKENKNKKSDFIDTLAKDLKIEFPTLKGMSARNLRYMQKIATEFDYDEFLQHHVAKLPSLTNEQAKK